MRLAEAMDELTCPAETELETSLSSLARAAPPQMSEMISKVRLTSSLARSSRAKRSSNSGRRTGVSPHTVSVMATVASPASRRCGNGVSGTFGSSSRSTLQSTMGNNVCGRSCSSHAVSASSVGVATPHRCRHGSPRWLLDLKSIRICSLASSASARLLEGVACGSVAMPSADSDVTAADSKSLIWTSTRERAASCAARMPSAMAWPARNCDSPTTSLARMTRKLRATPVRVTSSAPSHAARFVCCLTRSTTRAA